MLRGIASPAVPAAWPAVLPFIERALASGEDQAGPDDILRAVLALDMQLWALAGEDGEFAGAGVTELVRWPRKLVCVVRLWATDAPMAETRRALAVIEGWARVMKGASRIEIYGRRGWARTLPGYAPCATVLGKDLLP